VVATAELKSWCVRSLFVVDSSNRVGSDQGIKACLPVPSPGESVERAVVAEFGEVRGSLAAKKPWKL
jgi:hypothetical protein